MTPDELNQAKDVEYYAASVNAWFNTSLEHDKSLITLAAGGIGLLITLLTTVGLTSAEALVLYIGAIGSLLVSLISVLVVFRYNRIYIQLILSGKSPGSTPILRRADIVALWSFGVGVFFAAVIGISAAVHSYVAKETNVAEDKKQVTQTIRLRENLNGAVNHRSSADITRSFDGAEELRPAMPAGSTTESSSPQTVQPSSPASTPPSSVTPQPSNPKGKDQ